MSKRAVILLRASMDADDRTTLVTQEHECNAYASNSLMEVVGTFVDDGRSGYKPGTPRPGFDSAMRMIETGQADVLIVWKLDRMVRNLMRFMETWQRIQKAGGEFVSVVEQFDTTTTMGKLMLMIVAAFAEMESEMKRDRAIPFHDMRKREGLPPGGPRPYGYKRTDGALEVIDHEAAVIRGMVANVLAGLSLSIIAESIKSESGSKQVPMTLRGIKRILTSPTTAGLREHNGSYVQGNWEPIIERGEWEQVRTILNDPGRRTNFSNGRPAYLLSAFITCATCRTTMRTKSHPKGKRYLCRDCNTSLPVATADAHVANMLLDNIDPQAWKQLKEQGHGYRPEVIAALESEAEELADMKIKGELTMSQFRKLNADLAERMAAATNQEPLDLPDVDDLHSAWATGELSLEEQRTCISTLIKSVTVSPYVAGQSAPERIAIDWAA